MPKIGQTCVCFSKIAVKLLFQQWKIPSRIRSRKDLLELNSEFLLWKLQKIRTVFVEERELESHKIDTNLLKLDILTLLHLRISQEILKSFSFNRKKINLSSLCRLRFSFVWYKFFKLFPNFLMLKKGQF